jgi:hypothetical protein
LAGIAERADKFVVDLHPARWNNESAVSLVEGLTRERLDAQPGAVRDYLDFAWSQPEVIAQLLRNHQTSCLVNGCAHA